MIQKELINRAKKALGVTSDYALAQKLDISRASVSRHQKELSFFDTKLCVKLSHVLGCTPFDIISSIELERAKKAKDEKQINFWKEEIANLTEWSKRNRGET